MAFGGARRGILALAALLAIFFDAAIAHAMLWGNDPYWTYWVTDTLLMATVFGIGTMLFGIGMGRGAVITAFHVLLLTIYYWTLSPIGLPSQPEWLDLEAKLRHERQHRLDQRAL